MERLLNLPCAKLYAELLSEDVFNTNFAFYGKELNGQQEPIPGNFVNGRNSLGENISDVGGLSMAYRAYKLSLNGKEAPIIDGLTGDQRFFLAWAQVWKEKRTQQSMLNQLRGGTHVLVVLEHKHHVTTMHGTKHSMYNRVMPCIYQKINAYVFANNPIHFD
ncbi:hypothetical protein PSOS111911_09840 [Pseudoalteromonas ostreae]